METVYIETTIVSYLVADPSRDLLIAAHQQATREWWNLRREHFYCFASEQTEVEAARGDKAQAERRLAILSMLPIVTVTEQAADLAEAFLSTGALPQIARADAIHLGVAAHLQADFLLTWNCRHLANAEIVRRLEREAKRHGWVIPTVCTPLELMGSLSDETESDS